MQLVLENIGIHFDNQWVFRGVSSSFASNDKVVFLGDNGSGKSTLLKVCSGFLSPEEGTIDYTLENRTVDDIAPYIAYSAPYIELIEEMSLLEFMHFHFSFKRPLIGVEDMIEQIGLTGKEGELIENFSSGMKQRVSLAQAFFSDTPILLLDEPCSNLDDNGFKLYQTLLHQYGNHRIVLLASNDKREYADFSCRIELQQYK